LGSVLASRSTFLSRLNSCVLFDELRVLLSNFTFPLTE